jgi:hypothetical protein
MELVEMIAGRQLYEYEGWLVLQNKWLLSAKVRRRFGRLKGELDNMTLHLQLPCNPYLTKI